MFKSLALAGVMLVVVLTGCAKQPVSSGSQASAPAPGGARTDGAGGPGGGTFGSTPGGAGGSGLTGANRPAIKDFVAAPDLADIHFEFDRADIREADAKTLDSHAELAQGARRSSLLIEGHCDERGTNEYNTALGDRRAKATMNYLVVARRAGVADLPDQLRRGAAGLCAARRGLLGQEPARPLPDQGPLEKLRRRGRPGPAPAPPALSPAPLSVPQVDGARPLTRILTPREDLRLLHLLGARRRQLTARRAPSPAP